MRKYLISGVLTALFVSVSLGLGPKAAASTTSHKVKCSYQSVDSGYWTPREVQLTVKCAAEKFGVSLSTAMYVADRESNFRYNALNRSSGTCGIYQHMPAYWLGRLQTYNYHHPGALHVKSPKCFNARGNVLVSLWMASRGGWGPWSL